MFSELAGVDPEDHEAAKANVWLKAQGLSLLAAKKGLESARIRSFSGSDVLFWP